jgi:hypothetical protein
MTTAKEDNVKPFARFSPGRSLRTGCAALAAVLALTIAPAANAAEPSPDARALLLNMASFLAKAPAFDVTVRSGYDAIQADGQRIEFGEQRRVLLQRPDRVRVEIVRSDGDQGLLLFDGKGLTAFKADELVYAHVEKPGTVDDAVIYLVRDLQMIMPLARMFLSTFPQDLEKQLTEVSYVEENHIFDVPTDHLAARSTDIDLQVWITQGEQPLPRRVILTYKNAPGQPQFRADLSAWNLAPPVQADSFHFNPPAGAELVPFLAPVRRLDAIAPRKGDVQ